MNFVLSAVCLKTYTEMFLEMELFLERLGGKKNLAGKLIGLFLKRFKEKQAAIEKAVFDNNPEVLCASSHAFKGMLLHFCKKAADLAYTLEKMGEYGQIDQEKANAVLDNLQIIIDQIVPKLEEFYRDFNDQV